MFSRLGKKYWLNKCLNTIGRVYGPACIPLTRLARKLARSSPNYCLKRLKGPFYTAESCETAIMETGF